MLIDTHAHMYFDQFNDDIDAVIERANEAGVTKVIIPATELTNCHDVIGMCAQHDAFYGAVGIHPNATADWDASHIGQITEFAQAKKIVAIGEIGLDYYWDTSPKAVQHEAFSAQLALAAELDLPVIVHNRESSEDVVRLLSESDLVGRENAGVVHSFSAPWDIAKAILDMGFYLGFTGPVTYKKADDLREIVAKVPLDRILVETDAPFLTPQQHRRKRNEPAYVRFVAERIASVRNMSDEALFSATTANAERLFNLS